MDEQRSLDEYGLTPSEPAQLAEIREALRVETRKERASQGDGDTDLMRICCAQLFNAGSPEDAPLIWAAKRASMDANGAIDVQLLCGAGLEPTKAWLRARDEPAAQAALARLEAGEASGEFDGFTVAGWSQALADYYR